MGPTLIGLLQESVVKYPSLAALKSKDPGGDFFTITYSELYNRVKELGTGLISIGLQPRKHVAIIAENSYRWLITDLAILGCDGVDVPISSRVSDREIEYILSHSDSEFAFVENIAILNRVFTFRKRLPKLRKLILMESGTSKPYRERDPGAVRMYIYTWDEVLKKGKRKIERGERQFDLRAASVTSNATATIIYTSGTTGRPKGVALAHGNIMHNVVTVHANISPSPGMTWLSVLPVWHSFERTVEYCSIYFGNTIAYSLPSEWMIFSDLKVLKPNYLVVVPSLLESLQKSMEWKLGPFNTAFVHFEKFWSVFSRFVLGRYPRFKREERLFEILGAILPLIILSPVKLLSKLFFLGKIKGMMGGNLRAIICGGGPLPSYLDRFFTAIGLPILEGYGLTEASPVVSVRSERSPVMGTAGMPLPFTEVKIADRNGEAVPVGAKGTIMVKGPQVMQGYYKDILRTQEVISPEGWLNTGDTGLLTIDGNLIVTGRIKDRILLLTGERVEPEPIEMSLQESPYIEDAVVVGKHRQDPALLIIPHLENLKHYADLKRITFSSDDELVANPAIQRFYHDEIQSRLNGRWPFAGNGKEARFTILPVRFEVGRELTRTLSKRREVINRLYGSAIEKLYES